MILPKHFLRTPPLLLLLLLAIISLLAPSCQKDRFISSADASLGTSVDSLAFDTVFTSIGSTTQSFKINNNNNQRLLLSSVRLKAGVASAYKININGVAASDVSNIEIGANDSIYVFVTVKINPSLNNLPFIVRDTIEINYNGVQKNIGLEAYGQNANFLRDVVIHGNVNWNNTLPYVLLGTLRIDTTATLTMDAGCKIYLHANAPIIVDGTLITNGTKDNPVIFTGDRLDEGYRDLPSSWPGIYFRETSKGNTMRFTTVKNAYRGIVLENPSGNASPKLLLKQSVVDNAYDAGILCINSSIAADNCLISNCGSNISISLGGDYSFVNCTVAAYAPFFSHKKPVLDVSNYVLSGGNVITNDLSALFQNCIFWGEDGFVKDELQAARQGNSLYNVKFDHCIFKAETDPADCVIVASIKNEYPQFDSINASKNMFDFRINNSSAPGVNQGSTTIFNRDLDDNPRQNGLPDIGCYEKQP